MHIYRKVFNRNTLKISYSCISNIKSKISTHNKKILNKPVNQNTRKCNCINKNACLLNRNFLLKIILYITAIKSDKKNYQPRNLKELVRTHSKNDTQTIKDHSTSINIKTV